MGLIEIIKGFLALVFLQTSWSYEGRQTLGFLYAIILLAKNQSNSLNQGPTKSQIKERILRKISLNTNPYCTGAMIGIALNAEGEIFKDSYFSLQHIFGSIGDEFFWHLLRPGLLSAAVIFVLIGYVQSQNFCEIGIFMFSPLLFLLPYIFITQGIRVRGLYQGEKYGKNAAIFLIEGLRKQIPKLHKFLAFIMGIRVVLIPLIFVYNFSGPILQLGKSILATTLILIIMIISYFALRSERTSSYLLIVGLLIFLIIKFL